MASALPRDVRRIAVVVIIGAVMSILDTTIVNVALETLRIDLGAPLSTIQWVSTGYLLALAIAIPLTGWAAERFGPRRVWMTVVAAFVVTSGLALVSPGAGAIVLGISEYGAHRTFTVLSAWLPLTLGLLAVTAFAAYALRTRYPIIAVSLFRSGGFAAAAATVFLIGIALFGSMILLPLYYQVARGESPLIAGLLLAPQGLGAAIGMNLGGRATDRYGGGRVVLVGLAFLLAGTAVFTQIGANTSYWLIGGALVLRGIGLGVADSLADAFAHTFWFALALSAAALIPALLLAREERKARRRAVALPAAETEAADGQQTRRAAMGVT